MEPESSYEKLFPWVEETIGGTIVESQRQGDRRSGGRPAFFIDVETPTGLVRCYARMDRGAAQSPVFTLEREHTVLRILYDAGIAVPEPLGLCPEPVGLLLECLDGADDYSTIESGEQRDAIDRAFLSELARTHALDTEPFVRAGLSLPTCAEEFALADLAIWEQAFDRGARQPVPLVSFARQWLHRNVPAAPERASLIQGDTGPGQFLFEGDRLCGIVDWEFAHLADPMLDLAQIRTRDFYNPGADIPRWLRLYEEISGTAVDAKRLAYYTVKAMLITPLALAGVVQRMHPRTDHMEWFAQDATYKRATIESLAEAIGVDLEPAALPDAPASEYAEVFEIVEENLRHEQLAALDAADDPYPAYRMRMTLRLFAYARNAEQMGPALRELELDDMGALLGRRPATRSEGQQQIEALVRDAGTEREEELVRYFHRHALREEAPMRGGLGVGEDAAFQKLG